MLFSTKRLINRHRETRIYVTEIDYSRSGIPRTLYMYLPDEDTEIEADVYSVLYKKKIRSRLETLYHLALNKDFTLLLIVDHARGNHYVYCRLPVLHHLFYTNDLQDPLIVYKLEASSGAEKESHNRHQEKDRLTFIDTEVLKTHPELLTTMLKESTVILSPYYVMELDAYTTSYSEKLHIVNRVERLSRQFPNRVLINKNSANGHIRESKVAIAEAHENLLAAALQHPIDKSKMTIVTNDSVFAMRAKMQGLSAFIPNTEEQDQRQAGSTELVPINESSFIRSNETDSINDIHPIRDAIDAPYTQLYPPRSIRHRKTRTTVFSSFRSMLNHLLL